MPMDAIDRLRHDHQKLRDMLNVLEEALRTGAEAAEELTPLCASLSARLRVHIRAEGQMAVRCSRVGDRFGPEVLARLAVEHYTEQQYLRVLGRGLRRKPLGSIEHLRTPATALLHEFRRHMDEQEAVLFPFIEQVLWWRRETVGAAGPDVATRWTPRTTVFPRKGHRFLSLLKRAEREGAQMVDPSPT